MIKKVYKKLARERLKLIFKGEEVSDDMLDVFYKIAKNQEMCHHLIDIADSLGNEKSEMVWMMNLTSGTTIRHIATLKKLIIDKEVIL